MPVPAGTVEPVMLRQRTVKAALDADESEPGGLAVARFALEQGDRAWNPGTVSAMIQGPAKVTYERFHGRTTVRIDR